MKQKLYHAGVSRIDVERVGQKIKVNIAAARPGIIIGKKGAEVDKLKSELEALTKRSMRSTSRKSGSPSWTPSLWPRTSLSSLRGGLPFAGR